MDDIIINMFEKMDFNFTNIEESNDTIIEEEKMVITLTHTDKKKNNIKNLNETEIILGQCENEFRKYYNITEELYIKEIYITQPGLKIPKIEYEVYALFNNNNKLDRLNLSICEGFKIDFKFLYLLIFQI